MMDRILDFPQRDVEHAMVPRSQVDWVSPRDDARRAARTDVTRPHALPRDRRRGYARGCSFTCPTVLERLAIGRTDERVAAG